MLIGVVGDRGTVNRRLMLYALQHSPSYVIDCANCANPHVLFSAVEAERFSEVYVTEVDLLYKFRDVLDSTFKTARRLKVKNIIVTSFTGLFHYDDELENRQILQHAWELLKSLSRTYNVLVAGRHEFCDKIIGGEDMGHTVWSQRVAMDILLGELRSYAKALRGEDRKLCEQLLKQPLKHFGSMSYANSVHGWAFLLLSIMLEQERKIQQLQRQKYV